MDVTVLASPEEVAEVAADVIEETVRLCSRPVLGLATGASPMLTYSELIRRSRQPAAPDYAAVRCVLLDEYVGLRPGHPSSYLDTIRRELSDPLGIPRAGVLAPDPSPERLDDAGARYEAALTALGGVDLQLLGIGRNGHLAFNEPGSSLDSATRLVPLAASTRADNARFFPPGETVPTHAITQGLGTILRARRLLLVASGPAKRAAVAAALEGPVTTRCPASVLQLHPKVTVVLDAAAGADLTPAGPGIDQERVCAPGRLLTSDVTQHRRRDDVR